MKKYDLGKTTLERVADRGWSYTFRYMLLLQATMPTTRLGKWATAVVVSGLGLLLGHFGAELPL